MRQLTFTSLFSGAGGLDLGFEMAGFTHLDSVEIDKAACETLKLNRPYWNVINDDVRNYHPTITPAVLTAGFPCQGFSVSGHRNAEDPRNYLYREVIRIVDKRRPHIVMIENVPNIAKMKVPSSPSLSFLDDIVGNLNALGYNVRHKIIDASQYGVPQRRKRLILLAFREDLDHNEYVFPEPGVETPCGPFISEFIASSKHDVHISKSVTTKVHQITSGDHDANQAIPVRLSRTSAIGNPILSLDRPFLTIDTGTNYAWAYGSVTAERTGSKKLWRLTASQYSNFTRHEYAKLQTFPDDWLFAGDNARTIRTQIGNAVPVELARRFAKSISNLLNLYR